MTFLYYFLALALVTLGALTGNPSVVSVSVLPIGVLALLFQRFIHKDSVRILGFSGCSGAQTVVAAMLPIVIILFVFGIDLVFGSIRIQSLDVVPHPSDSSVIGISFFGLVGIIVISAIVTMFGSFFTEELAFRGYLITRLRNMGAMRAALLSALLFGFWHLPASLFVLHPDRVTSVVYVLNIVLLGILLAGLYLESGSLIPPSICHGVWNALDYTLFGFGATRGVFPGQSRIIFDPDEGIVGTMVLLAACILWIRMKGGSLRGKQTVTDGAVIA